MRTIYLGRDSQYECKVSDEDYDYLIQWCWSFKRSSKKYGYSIYARRGGSVGNHRSGDYRHKTIQMHWVVMARKGEPSPPTPEHTVDHKDGDTLNNQRDNLCWATKKEQTANRRRRNGTGNPLRADPSALQGRDVPVDF
jgi:hypothetical protein